MNTTDKVQDWEALAESIREELRECAWLLTLMDRQQKAILSREVEALNDLTAEIDGQARTVEDCRAVRLALMDGHTGALGISRTYSIRALALHVPLVLHPLFLALADEAQTLLTRIQRRARQNQMLLARASDFAGQLLDTLRPGSQVRTYTRRGMLTTHSGLRGSVVHTAV